MQIAGAESGSMHWCTDGGAGQAAPGWMVRVHEQVPGGVRGDVINLASGHVRTGFVPEGHIGSAVSAGDREMHRIRLGGITLPSCATALAAIQDFFSTGSR